MSEISEFAPSITAAELGRLGGEIMILDLRSPIEFESEHIAKAVNIPLAELKARSKDLPRKGELILVCRSGKRAEQGAYLLLQEAYHPRILAGGLLAWKKAGLPLVKGKQMISIERQIQLVVGVSVLTGTLLGVLVSPWFLVICGFFGLGLTFAGLTGTCALGLLLMKAPWNRLPAIKNDPCKIAYKSENTEKRGSCCS